MDSRAIDNRTIEKELYYHGLLPREDIRSMLKRNKEFLVRTTEPTAGKPRAFVISVMYDEKREEAGIKHFVIQQSSAGQYIIQAVPFDTVPQLIDYYVKNEQSVSRTDHVVIKFPVNRAAWELCHDDIIITKKLGEGAFGEVSLGRLITKSGEQVTVAIKQAKLEAMTKEQIKDITREARLMRNFHHPNIVKLYGVAAGREPLMIVMELADKGSLDGYLQKNELPINQRITMCMEASFGVEYLHSKNVIHRDIAARNCLYGDGKVKISDFGLTCEGTTFTEDPRKRLPIRWLAPETLRTAMYSQKTDTFAFGILCWEIIMHGAMPYPELSVAEVSVRVKEGYRMKFPQECPQDFTDVIVIHCWVDSAEERWSMPQVVNRLQEITHVYRPKCEMTPTEAPDRDPGTERRRGGRRKGRRQSRGASKQ